MTDYRNLKLTATSSPHIRVAENTRSIMLDMIFALLPALAFACWNFGFRALAVTGVSAAGCVFWEWLYRALRKKPASVGDLSAVVTGILLAFVCPVQIAYWQILIGDFFAIVVVKQLFGGIGKNFMNPALAARAFLLISWAGAMTTWAAAGTHAVIFGSNADLTTASAPLSFLQGTDLVTSFQTLTSQTSLTDLFLGRVSGPLGEVSALMLLLGGVYLLARRVITWQIPVCYLGTVAALTALFPRGNHPVEWTLYSVLSGGVMLGAFFLATDYASSPVTGAGRAVYGIGCGLFTVLIQYFGAVGEGTGYAILIMNCIAPLIDKGLHPSHAGEIRPGEEAAK